MTSKELEWKKIKDLLSPYMEFKTHDGWVLGRLNGFTMFTYFGEHNMAVHFINDFHSEMQGTRFDWDYEVCSNYYDVLRLLPKIKDTFLELKFPGYHEKLKRIQDDC